MMRFLNPLLSMVERSPMETFMKSKVLAVAFVMACMAGQAFAGDAKITGKIMMTGDIPPVRVLKMDSDAKCVANNAGKEVKSHALVLGAGNTISNVFVKVKSGLKPGVTHALPATPVEIDQYGCMYMPHVVAAMKGQTVRVKNSDGTLHNVHGLPTANAEFNVPMPPMKKVMDKTFDKAEDPFRIKCDVHPWMEGYVAVMDHPYFSVTKEDGTFTISGLDAGEYEIEVWHEKLGTQTAKVTVGAGETKTQDFSLSKPAAVGQLDAVMIVR